MTTRYHFNPDSGKPGVCNAMYRCRFGFAEGQHADSPAEAAKLYEDMIEESRIAAASIGLAKFGPLPDPDGELMYHGSPTLFEEFSFSAPRLNGSSDGDGFNLTNNHDVASTYSSINGQGYVYEVDFVGKRGVEAGDRTVTREQWREIVDEYDQKHGYLEDWGDVDSEGRDVVMNRTLDTIAGEYSDDESTISDIIGSSSDSSDFYELLHRKTGIDHFVSKDQWGPAGSIVRVATVPSAVKLRRAIIAVDFEEEFLL